MDEDGTQDDVRPNRQDVKLPAITVKRRASRVSLALDNGNDQIQRRESLAKQSIDRRLSGINLFPQGSPTRRRSSFKAVGARVSRMIKISKNFKPSQKVPEQEEEENPMEKIVEVPKQARFASKMSAEAQYATLKGYEDMLHYSLSCHFPEYSNMLRRNKTPNVRVLLLRQQIAQEQQESSASAMKSDAYDENGVSPKKKSVPYYKSNTCAPGDNMASKDVYDVWENDRIRDPKRNRISPEEKLLRSKTLPDAIPKQLIMTYRLQSAMDILDVVRSDVGQNVISPRIKTNVRKIMPLKDYNYWTDVWSKEFNYK